MTSVAKASPHQARLRWRGLAVLGALGLMLLIGGISPAHAQVNTSSSVAQAKTSITLRPQATPCSTGPNQPGPPCPPADGPMQNLTNWCGSAGNQVNYAGACDDLETELQQWTRWAAWLLGGFAVLWILMAFFRTAEPFGHSMDGPWRRIWLRVVEAAAIFLIAWRIGEVASVIEGILWTNRDDVPAVGSNNAGLLGLPQHAIAQLLGLATAVIVQVFLIYLAPRVVVQILTVLSSGFVAPTTLHSRYPPLINSIFQLLVMGVAIFYAPTVLIWIFTLLTG
jgi:hypothetical protein